ncbi:MAG: tail fiber domain-containing protein [Emergencia sp.]
MSKQDANGVRTAADLERKYNFDTLKKAVEQNENGLTKTNKELENFVQEVGDTFGKIEQQLDGQIVTWYGNGEPTLSNYPANEWNNTDYENHEGDLYYDMDSGYPYRFILEGTTYKWEKLSDDDLSNVLAIASHAKDTADKKRRVFVTTPTPPYDVGDLWLKTITQKNIYGQNVNQTVLYRCSAAKGRDETYAESDFVSAVNYATNNSFETVEHKAEAAAETATDFIRIDTNDGVIIGDQYDLGGNLLLKSGDNPGMYVRNGENILAYYLANTIGIGDHVAKIELCGGACEIDGLVEDTSKRVRIKGGSNAYITIGRLNTETERGIQLNPGEGETYVSGAVFWSQPVYENSNGVRKNLSLEGHTHSGYASSSHDHSKLTNSTATVLLTGAFLRPTSNGDVYLGGSGYRWGEIYASKEVNVSSDMRLKKDFSVDFDKYIQMLDLLEPTSYHLINDDGSRHTGYIAQKVWKAMEDVGLEESEFAGLVREMQAEGSVYTYGLRYGEFIPILHAKIKTLEERIEKLEQMLEK